MCYNFCDTQTGIARLKNLLFLAKLVVNFKLKGIDLIVDTILAIAKTITKLIIKLPLQFKSIYHILLLTNQLKLPYNEKNWQSIEKI